MTSFGYRLNPHYAIKEGLSCGALYTGDFCCLKENVEDKILVPKLPKNCARCSKCGHPVNGPYCQGCSLLREKLEEDLVTYVKYFQDTFELSDDSTNVVNAPREPFVVKQDHGVKSSQNPPHIDECHCECGNALDGIYCQQCISPFINPEPGYSQDFNFPQDIHNFQQQYLCCDQYVGPHKTFQCQQVVFHEPCCENYGGPHENFQCQPLNYYEPNPSYDSNYSGFDQFGDFHPQQNICCENFGGPHETFQCQPTNEDYYHEQNSCYSSNSFGSDHCQPPQYTVNHPIFDAHNDLLSSRTTLMEQMTQLTSICEMVCQIFQKKQEEKRIEEEQAANARYWKIPACCDDDDDYNSAITPVLSTKEPVDSLSMGDEHLDTIPAMESDKVIKSSVEDLVPIPSEFEEEEIEDDNLREKLLNVHLLIANIEALKDNPTQSFELLTKSSSISPKSFLEETNTFHNSLPEFENFYFDLEEISSGSTTTHSDISLPDYEAFYFDDDHIEEISDGSTTTHSDISLSEYDSSFDDEHIEEISSGSTTTHSDISLSEYESFVFDPSNDQFPPTDRSGLTNEEFADELTHIISPPEYDCFYFWNFPDLGKDCA
uniref:Pre-mRNA splicing Prp18-interacting factor n=1 Tax=Tanacetum cinerariifolium TaxID=118510 RepID=A0A6L2NKM6_TANCI|nr:hypothetical protein [Tanacetum cinerariifolium]